MFMGVADSSMQGRSWIYSADTCKIIKSLVKLVCVLLYLLNQATYRIAPKGQCFGPRHRRAHVEDAPPAAYNTMGCFLWNYKKEVIPGPKRSCRVELVSCSILSKSFAAQFGLVYQDCMKIISFEVFVVPKWLVVMERHQGPGPVCQQMQHLIQVDPGDYFCHLKYVVNVSLRF